jgi:RNA polymerase sigma factor (sigma-70 family)
MAGEHLDAALRQIHRLFDSDAADEHLLERFLQGHDEAAFSSLLRRYGPMVLHVCGRVLQARHDVEDAFQATFLMLARKAGEIRKRSSVASWLHGTAYRLSVQMRRQDCKRKQREQSAAPPGSSDEPASAAAWHELQEVLDEELARLPEKYRAPLVLCYLEGKTHEEAAAQLGWPLGTVRGNVARGREALKQRLERRGMACSGLVLGLSLAVRTLPQTLPPGLLAGTLSASLRYAAGTSAAALVSARAAALVEGAIGMLKVKLSLAAAFLLGVGIVAIAAASARDGEKDEDKPGKDAPPVLTDSLGDELPPGARLRLGTARLNPGGAGQAAPAFSADGKLLAYPLFSGDIAIWSVKDGKRLHTLPKADEAVFNVGTGGVAFSPDNALLYVTHTSARVIAREVKTGKSVRTFIGGGAQPFNALALSRDGKRLAAVGNDGLVAVWDADGKRVKGFEGHKEAVRSVAFSPDGKRLVTGGADGTARLWDALAGKEIKQLPENRGDVIGLAFSSDGKSLAVLGTDDMIRLFDAESAKEKAAGPCPPGRTGRFGRCELAFTADGKRIVVTGAGSGQLFDVAEQKLVPAPWPGTGDFPRQGVSADGKLIATALNTSRIEVFDVATGKARHDFTTHAGQVTSAAWSSKGVIATGGNDRLIRLWDAKNGKQIRVIKGHLGPVAALAFSPDGKTLASGGSQFNDQGVSLWDVETGKQLRHVRGTRSGASSLSFSPDGKQLLCQAGFGIAVIRDAKDGKALHETKGMTGQAIAASPDGKFLAHPGGGFPPTKIVLLDRKGEQVKDIDISGDIDERAFLTGVAFTPDSKGVMFITNNGTLCLYDVERGTRVRKTADTDGLPMGARFQAKGPVVRGDSRVALFVDATGQTRVIELASGKERLSFDSTHGGVLALTVSPDGRSLITGGNDGAALVWDLWALPAVAAPKEAMTDKQLDAAWAELSGTDAVKAGRAIRLLALSAKESVPFLAQKLTPEKVEDKTKIGDLVGQLDSDDFETRKKAEAALEKAGEGARAALEAALKKKPSLDASKRIKGLLAKLGSESAPPAKLARIRGIEALEAAGTDAAKELLKKLSEGDKGDQMAAEAAAALARLKR